ncbi:glycoside hydrolase family 13 protein [Flavobacterium soyangense]|uniref:Glycoside hydrolase family 13 protein n=1 Tax=Flavobacterium soyangense TaxID=2023265 RepID=A0A930UA54_9FLAO|nr:glycoside hydrolase family 13 protein [Flavobacterium soyangense]MBF2709763.1 glycoside hydrolase family 13 protein [Flavobacterium soyangense]
MFAQIERIEPPFWYAGMYNPKLQIMFYGKNIAQFLVTVSNSIKITNVKRTENPNYLFVTIDTKNVKATECIFTFKDSNKKAFTQNYSLKQRRENSAQRLSYDSSDMMYLLMPDRFSNGNPNNDSDTSTTEKYNRELPEGRHGGDIQGIINHLDYIKELGATTLWITPLCEDNEAVYSYHTYAQTDVYKIDPRYGTNEDYARLAAEIHQKNLKLVMDYVTNHWGLQHWMMKDLPTQDWIHLFENFTQTNHRRTVIHDTNASKIDTKICMDGWFAPSMPDLNQANSLVLNYLTQNAIWWIEYANLDGLRVDTYNYADPEAIAKWTKAITDEYPNFNIVGEISMRDHAQLSYWQKDSPIGKIQNFNSYLPSLMDFILSDALLTIFNEDGNWETGMIRIYNNFANDFLFPNVNNLLIFAENHDTQRINHVYKNDIGKYKMTMSLLATVRGIPQLYYGSEVGMAGNKDNGGDAAIRQDFPGGWEGDAINAFTKEARTQGQNEYFDFTSKLFNWRKNKSVLHFGKMTHYIPEDNTYVYFRYNATDPSVSELAEQSVMVLFNNSSDTKTLKTNRFAENIGNYKTGKDVITEKIIDVTNEIFMDAKSVLILELR